MGQPNIMKPEHGLLEEAGDRWMRSLTVAIVCGEGRVEIDGYRFEELTLAMRIRHLAVNPRSRDVLPGSMPAERFSDLIERNWSSIESWDLTDVALRIQDVCRSGDVRWALA